jgi:uncharacterized protein YbaR (Trm112 family)
MDVKAAARRHRERQERRGLSLIDLLACPLCKHAVVPDTAAALRCTACAKTYPVVNGVPVMLPDPSAAQVEHESHLGVREGYSAWKDRLLLQSLTDAQVVLDFGAGRQRLDDPCVIRMDITLNPFVDVVGDLQALPFRPGTVDYAFGGAVMEHIPNPWAAAAELWSVLKPGGYVYADWNFIFAYHGYPHHYFNASKHGVREVFKAFTILDIGVAPFHAPSFALTSFIATYLRHFRAQTRLEHDFALHLNKVLLYPIEEYDAGIPEDDRFRVAASAYVLGVKQPAGHEHVIPPPVMAAYERSDDLRRRFPRPLDLTTPDNLMIWARTEGIAADQGIAAYFRELVPFTKHADGRPFDRATVRGWPLEVIDRMPPAPEDAERAERLWQSLPLWLRLREAREREGVAGMARAVLLTVRLSGQALAQLFRSVLQRGR